VEHPTQRQTPPSHNAHIPVIIPSPVTYVLSVPVVYTYNSWVASLINRICQGYNNFESNEVWAGYEMRMKGAWLYVNVISFTICS
jgi:hypothetical protein